MRPGPLDRSGHTTTWSALIGALIKGEALSSDETAWAMGEIMEGAATPAQIAGFGVALRMKGETAGEVGGLAEAMLDRATPIRVPGPLVDLVGTGGDGAHTVNISTMGAIVAAAAGRPDGQARQPGGLLGLRRRRRARGPGCGHRPAAGATARLAEETGIAFLFAPLYHPALAALRRARGASSGVPTVFNFLGPVANPARPGAQAVGVADPRMGPMHRRGAGRARLLARWCSTATTGWTS